MNLKNVVLIGLLGEAGMDVKSVVVTVTNTPLSQEEYHQLSLRINPLRESNSYGIDIYLEGIC